MYVLLLPPTHKITNYCLIVIHTTTLNLVVFRIVKKGELLLNKNRLILKMQIKKF